SAVLRSARPTGTAFGPSRPSSTGCAGPSCSTGSRLLCTRLNLPRLPSRVHALRPCRRLRKNVFLIVRDETKSGNGTIEYGCSVLTAGSTAAVYKARQQIDKKDLD